MKRKLKATWDVDTDQGLASYHNLFTHHWYDWILHPFNTYNRKQDMKLRCEAIKKSMTDVIDNEILKQISNSEYWKAHIKNENE